MDKEILIRQLKNKPDIDVYAARAIAKHEMIPILFEIIENDTGSVKFTCEKIIRRISEQKPEVLYPSFKRLAKLMDSANSFLRWGNILTLPNMLGVDKDGKWEGISGRFLKFIDSESIVEFGNAGSGSIQDIGGLSPVRRRNRTKNVIHRLAPLRA